jgi:transposase-like protein
MPRPYPPEFRQRALDLVRSGRPVPEVAELLGIAESCVYRWKKQDLTDRGLEPGTSRAESAELVAARQKIRDLEEENKILRKAAAAAGRRCPQKSGTASWPSSTVTGSASARPATRWTCRRPATATGRPGRRRPGRSGTPG